MTIYDDLIKVKEETKEEVEGFFKKAARVFLPKSIEEKIFGPKPEKASESKPEQEPLTGSIYDDLLPSVKKTAEPVVQQKKTPVEAVLEPYDPTKSYIIEDGKRISATEAKPLTARERILKWGEAWEKYDTQRDQQARVEDLAQFQTVIDQDYKEPEGFWGQFGEAIKEGTVATLAGLGGGIEAAGKTRGKENWVVDIGQKMQRKFDKILLENPEWAEPTDLERWTDRRHYARLIGGGLPTTLGGVATIIAANFAGGPVAAFAVGTGLFGTLEGGAAYREALQGGASESDARRIAGIVGSINGAIETVFPGNLILRNAGVLKPFTGSLTRRITAAVLEGALTEGVFEEGTQGIISNIVAQSYDENRGAFDGILEQIVGGSILGGLLGPLLGGASQRIPGKAELPPAGEAPKEAPEEREEKPKKTEQRLAETTDIYVRSGGFAAGTQTENAALRDLAEILKTKEGQDISRERIETAVDSNYVKVDDDGLVNVYRAGEVLKGRELVSFTLSREVAENFAEQAKQEGREALPITEMKVPLESIALLIRGDEQEVLVRPEALKVEVGPRQTNQELKQLEDLTQRAVGLDSKEEFVDSLSVVEAELIRNTGVSPEEFFDIRLEEKTTGFKAVPTTRASEEFKVGDVLDTQGKTNMVSPVRIREITGNTLKFTDAEGTDYAGMARATVRNLINEGSWRRIEEVVARADKIITDSETELRRVYGESGEAQKTLKGLLQEMDESQAGDRIFIERPDSSDPDILAISSTFPEWVEPENRSKPLFEKVFGGLLDISKLEYPRGVRSRQRALYDDVLDELDSRLGVDTKDLRNAIIGAYETKSQKVSKEGEPSVEGRTLPRTAEELRREREGREGEIETEKLFEEGGVPGVGAAEGVFIEGLEPEEGRIPQSLRDLDKIRPIEFPELVDLVRDLIQKPPTVTEIRGWAIGRAGGVEGAPGTARMELEPQLFKRGNSEQLSKTIAHEIGHLIDFLPEGRLTRGNLLGHLLSLRRHLKNTFGSITVTNKELREELVGLSHFWKPISRPGNTRYMQYRNSAVELYADFVSVLFNNPGLAEKRAPKFYEEFFASLDNKQNVKDAYFSLQAFLTGGRDDLVKNRRQGVRGMLDEGDYKAAELQRVRAAERERREDDFMFRLRFDVIDKTAAVRDKVKELEDRGVHIKDDDNPIYYLEDSNYIGGKIRALIRRGPQKIKDRLDDAGISWTDFGEALFYERIVAGDRSDVANPRGITPKVAGELLDALKTEMGEEKYTVLQEGSVEFRAWMRQISEEAYKEGLYTEELWKQMQDNPAYVTFQVIEHIEDGMSSKVHHQIGTLKDITNPADATILKSIATLRAIERNKVNRSIINFLQENFPGEIEDAKKIFTGKGFRFLDPRGEFENLMVYFDKGAPQGFKVDQYIAQSVEYNSAAQNNVIIGTLKFFNSRLFRPLFITFNLGFQAFNLQRDFFRYWKNIPGMTMAQALKNYKGVVRIAKIRAFGLPKTPSAADTEAYEKLDQLEYEQVLSVTFNDLVLGQDVQDRQIDEIMRRSGILKEKPTRKILRPFVSILKFIKSLGDMIETLPKVAGYYQLEGKLPPREARSFVRRKVGSPDFLLKGRWTPATNEIFLFSNAIIQGIRADVEIATEPTTRSGFWWKTTKLNFMPKILMFAALAGLFGDRLKDRMEDASEYDMTNYTIIPLGVDDRTGKTIYLRIPQDETGRTLAGVFWKVLRGFQNDQGVLKDITDVASYTGGQLPSLSPTISAFTSTAQFLSGQNPYDYFRGRNVLTDDQFNAGGKEALKPFLTWQFQQLGGGTFLKLYPTYGTPKEKSPGEKFLSLPLLSNVIGRFIKISDYGETEKLREITTGVESERAKERLAEGRILNKYVEMWQMEEVTNMGMLERDFVEEVLGHRPRTKDEKEEAGRLEKKLNIAVIKGESDPKINALISARSNAEKLELLAAYQESLSAEEFSELKKLVLREKIVSKDVFIDLRKQ